jgi:hypothetical protein
MARGWVGRRRLTLGLGSFFAVWYLAQLATVSAFGTDVAVWWFYFTGDPSPGYLLAPLSHNMADPGHLRRNLSVLFIAGGLAEPYLNDRQYIALLLAVSFGSVVITNVLSLVFGTLWTLADPSGGIYGLWAYIGVRNRALFLDPDGCAEWVEAVLVVAGVLTLALVPAIDAYTTGAVNVSHAVGILLGYAVALREALPQIGTPIDE